MLSKRLLLYFLFVFTVSSFFIFTSETKAQRPSGESGKPGGEKRIGDLGARRQNSEAIKKLKRMTPEQVKALDEKLTEALEYYYDRDFSSAYPIFKEVADQVDTMDIMYWLGVSAMEVGKVDVAIENFKKILGIDPYLNKVRIQLARAYLQAGYFKEARQELDMVKKSSPSPAEMRHIDALSKALDEKGKIFIWNLKVSQGMLYDDNVNASADQDEYDTLLGTVDRNDRNKRLRELASVSSVAGNFLIDFGEPRGFMWDTTASFYNKSYFDYSDYNYMRMEATTGPWWAGRNFLFKLPSGYVEQRFGNDRLGYVLNSEPSFQYDFCRYFSLKGLYSFSYTDYSSDERSPLDSYEHSFEVSPIFFFAGRRVILMPGGGYQNHNADVSKYSYDGPFFSASLMTAFPTRTTLFFRYQWFKKDYDARALPLYDEFRHDKQGVLTAAIRQGIYKGLFATFIFTYIHNDSNLEIYEYDRRIYMLNFEYRF